MALKPKVQDVAEAILNHIISHANISGNSSQKGHVQAGGNPQDINTIGNSSAGTDNSYYARADHVHKIATASTSSKGIVQLDSTPTANSNNAISSGGVKNYIDNLPSGSTVTKTSDLSNDGSDGQHPFLDTSELLDLTYPVGAIYMSVNSTSPATLFGGTWERLQDRFLVGASDTVSSRAAGKTGGSETVTLTENQMPSHTHTQNAHTHIQDAHTHTQDAHTHTQNAHTHTQNAHTHIQDAHTHTQQEHSHKAQTDKFLTVDTAPGVGSQKRVATSNSSGNYYWQNVSTPKITTYQYTGASTAANNNATATNQDTIATNQNTVATNQDTTATNQNTTATNQNTTATNQNTGGGAAHENMPPYLAVYMWKRTR